MIEKNISLGNILTMLTIIGSVISFLVTWNKEIDTRRSAQANQIRVAAAKTLVKLDRWKTVSFSLFDQIRPDFVDTKEMLKKKFDVIEARDHLWKALHVTRAALLRRASEDQLRSRSPFARWRTVHRGGNTCESSVCECLAGRISC